MKKILPYFLVLIMIMLIIPALAFTSGQPPQSGEAISLFPTSPNKPVKLADGELVYKVFNHKTNEVMELSPLQYIKGVVAAEMPIDFHTSALSAQAVAAHTYTLRQIAQEQKNPTPTLMGAYLTTDYTKNQAYISDVELKEKWGSNYSNNMKKLNDAVESVIDQIMVVDDKPIIAAFHSLSTGITESAKNVWGQDVAYLSPVKSEGDNLSPKYNVNTVLTEAEVQSAVLAVYPEAKFGEDRASWFEIIEVTPSDTVAKVRVGDVELSGKELRELLILKSASFDVSYKDGSFTFSTRGYGHGVGMSQYGADYLARQGSSYTDILLHYYTGVEIISIKNLQKSVDTE